MAVVDRTNLVYIQGNKTLFKEAIGFVVFKTIKTIMFASLVYLDTRLGDTIQSIWTKRYYISLCIMDENLDINI